MAFLLSRQDLQDIVPIVQQGNRQKYIELVVEDMKHEIITKACAGRERMLKLDLAMVYRRHGRVLSHYQVTYRNNVREDSVPAILEKLSEAFPGVGFQVDPLKTYILADWS